MTGLFGTQTIPPDMQVEPPSSSCFSSTNALEITDLQYNSLLAGTPGIGSPYTYLPTSREFNADFLITYLVHPGTAIYVGYNSDLQNLSVLQRTPTMPGYVTNIARGYLNDSRQFFVKVSYLFRF